MRTTLTLLAVLVLLSYSANQLCAQTSSDITLNHSIIPEPQLVEIRDSPPMAVTQKTLLIAIGEQQQNSAQFLKKYLSKYYNLEIDIITSQSELKRIKKGRESSIIWLEITPLESVLNHPKDTFRTHQLTKEGAYHIEISKSRATLTGANPHGLFYAVQTLIQLLPQSSGTTTTAQALGQESLTLSLPALEIVDFPRFEYRGMHLDVVRHIYSVEYLKQYLDYIALHKMNYFHWHLTDDQGWRIESKSHPKLNQIGSWRAATIIGLFPGTGVDSTRYGGYYTVEEIKEIVEYAAKRYITIVPEIDVPGHSMAILATYPHFSTTPHIPKEPAITWGIFNRENNVLAPSKELFSFLEDVFNELMDLFPGPYIHIGADECAKRWWQESLETQQFMREHGIEDESALQRYFAQQIANVVHARGRNFIGWDEMLDNGLVEGAMVMSWRNVQNGYKAASQGHKTILTPAMHSYLNIAQKENEDTLCHTQWLVTLSDVYNFEPLPKGSSSQVVENIIGGQGCMWTEYFPHRQRLEYALFPRMSAIAEVYWSSPKKREWNRFKLKLQDQYKRYTLWGANYSKEIF